MARKIVHGSDKFAMSLKKKCDKISLYAESGYSCNGEKLAYIRNNQNGYDVKFHSHSSVHATVRMNLDYDQAEYLYFLLKEEFES